MGVRGECGRFISAELSYVTQPIPYSHDLSHGKKERNTPPASRRVNTAERNRYLMPVIHDVDAFSGEWHHKSHKKLSMGCLPSSFVGFATSWSLKLTNGAARWRCSERPSSVRSLCERSSRGFPQERQPSFLLRLDGTWYQRRGLKRAKNGLLSADRS
jgi:hypothetical protein